MEIIDFHTHAFADAIAPRAMAALEAGAATRGFLNGTVKALLESMDAAGIARSVVHSIATRPAQFLPILQWSEKIRSDRIIPFPSVHPADPAAAENIRRIRDAGFRGIKLHPYYQDFTLDAPELDPIYETAHGCGLAIFSHTGFDMAYPRDRRADPRRIMHVVRRFPGLCFISTHCGAWCDWEEVRRHLLGQPIWIDTAFSLECMDAGSARELLLGHPAERLLFGTDSPWADQARAIALVRRLDLGAPREGMLLGGNAARLLASLAGMA